MYLEELERIKNELKYRKYSPKTIENYVRCARDYFEYLKKALKINSHVVMH